MRKRGILRVMRRVNLRMLPVYRPYSDTYDIARRRWRRCKDMLMLLNYATCPSNRSSFGAQRREVSRRRFIGLMFIVAVVRGGGSVAWQQEPNATVVMRYKAYMRAAAGCAARVLLRDSGAGAQHVERPYGGLRCCFSPRCR